MQLEPLAFEEKANRRYKNATPTKLYSTAEVSFLKWLLQRTDTLPHMTLQPLPAAQTFKHVNACCFTGRPPLSLSSSLHQSTANLLVPQTAVQCGLRTFHVHPLCLPVTHVLLLQLEKVAVDKWGGMSEVEAERNAREQKRLKRALETTGRLSGMNTCLPACPCSSSYRVCK